MATEEKFEPFVGTILTVTSYDYSMMEAMCGIGASIMLTDLDERYLVRDEASAQILAWSKQGHRIAFFGSGGSVIVSRTKTADPHYPGAAK